MQKRLDRLEAWMIETTKQLAAHEEMLAITQNNLTNTEHNLNDLKDAMKEHTKLLHDILFKIRS